MFVLTLNAVLVMLSGCTEKIATPVLAAAIAPASGTIGNLILPEIKIPEITWKQFRDIKINITIEEVNNAFGVEGSLVSEGSGIWTYEYKVKDDPNLYAKLVFTGGKLIEKSTFKK